MRTATTEAMLTTSQTIELGLRGGCAFSHSSSQQGPRRSGPSLTIYKREMTHQKTRHAPPPHALSAVTLERDERVAKDVVDELVHRRLFEARRLARLGRELARSFDLLGEEVGDVCERLSGSLHDEL